MGDLVVLLEVRLPDQRWVPMQPARHQGLPFTEIRTAPQVYQLFHLLAMLGMKKPRAALLLDAGIYQ